MKSIDIEIFAWYSLIKRTFIRTHWEEIILTLNDLADEYLNSANLIKNRIDELTLAIQNTENQEIVYELRTRISTLYEILNECSATAIFLNHYYDK